MTKSKREFKPTHYLDISVEVTLLIEVVVENGECFVYGAYYDNFNRSFDKVTKSSVRNNRYGNSYFIKNHQRYYLADFLKKTPF